MRGADPAEGVEKHGVGIARTCGKCVDEELFCQRQNLPFGLAQEGKRPIAFAGGLCTADEVDYFADIAG